MPWDHDVVLPPIDAETYPAASGPSLLISRRYASQAQSQKDRVPLPQIRPGQSLRIQVLVPPGVASASIKAESNQWQGGAGSGNDNAPAMLGCEHDSGDYQSHPLQRPSGGFGDGQIYFSDLHPAGGGLNEQLYGNGSPMNPPVAEPCYVYFYFYNPLSSVMFTFETMSISMLVTDTGLYNAWRAPRPWAGGASPDHDGIDAPPMEHEVTPSKTAMILNHPQRKITGTQFSQTIHVNGALSAANTAISMGSSLVVDLQMDPDPRDMGKSGSYIAVAGWQDKDTHTDLTKALWQQCSGGVWQNWAGPNFGADGSIKISTIQAYAPPVTIAASKISMNLGKISPPAGLSNNSRLVAILIGYQCNESGNNYIVLTQPMGFAVT